MNDKIRKTMKVINKKDNTYQKSDDELPIAFCVSKANKRESEFTFRLFSDLRDILGDLKIRYVIADCGYDSNKCHDEAMEILDAQLIAPFNRRKSKIVYSRPLPLLLRHKLKDRGSNRDINGLLYYSKEGKRLYRNKVKVERLNDEIKNDYKFEEYFQKFIGEDIIEYEVEWSLLSLIVNKFYEKIRRNKICNQLIEIVL